jgi:hypothetical protein
MWIIRLIGRLLKSQKPEEPMSAPKRKKVDSVVIEKENHDNSGDDTP